MKQHIHIPTQITKSLNKPRPHFQAAFAVLFFVLCQAALCLPAPAPAATVNYDSGSAGHVIGNDGIGAVTSTPADNANASGNTVNVTGGTITNGIYGGIHSTTTGNATRADNNRINVGSAFAGNLSDLYVNGGFARANTASATASGNAVNINGGLFKEITGGYARSTSGAATAHNNTVNFTSGMVTTIYGGVASTGTAASYAASASGNHVVISGGTVTGAVYGGSSTGGTGSGATNNTVTIAGAPTLAGVVIYGGTSSGATSGDAWSGNTLEIKTAGVGVRQISAFQYLNFYVSDSVGNQDTLLTVTDAAFINNSTVRVAMSGNDSPLQVGDTITLIAANNLSGTPANNGGRGIQGISKIYAFEINADSNTDKLTATVLSIDESGGGQIDAQLKSLGESRIAGLGLLTQGQYMLDARVIPHLRSLAPQTFGPVAFGITGGDAVRYHSGSHVDVKSFNLITGLGWNVPPDEIKNGKLLIGAFFEAGWGNYDAYNSFGNAASIKGGGNTRHYGGGILARYDTVPLNLIAASGNLYLEASIRVGQVETDYSSSDFLAASGNNVSFDSSAAYAGAHAGLGLIWNITEKTSLDLHTKYLWTRQNSDSVTIEGDSILFKSMSSRRWRTGARLNNVLKLRSGTVFTPYGGAAYEYEFDSRAGASNNGVALDVPDVKGSTGIGELGLALKPAAASGLSIDLGARLYLGERTGGGGSLQVKWAF